FLLLVIKFGGVHCTQHMAWSPSFGIPMIANCSHLTLRGIRRLTRRFVYTSSKIIYEQNGNPLEVLQLSKEKINETALGTNEVLVRWMASPINPADINQIQGVYPIKPSLPAIGGNEGCARVEKVGSGVTELKEGDVVLPANAGLGTWLTHGVYRAGQLFPLDESLKLDSISASMLQVNPSTAYRMLHDFIKLVPGDLIVQNGGNSSVGRFVIQMCRNLGFKSISVVA
uniref:Enoyl-[acyl-carrier-protein] reductase, mitochondrial n=1 Tax=Globodera pallida TaxID=36090 RepID=A0A183CMA5_GLOPA